MIVQNERTRPRHLPISVPNPRSIHEEGEEKKEKEDSESESEERIHTNGRNGTGLKKPFVRSPKHWDALKGLGGFGEKLSLNLPKLAIVGLIFFGVAILFLVKNRGDAAALLCVESMVKEAEGDGIPYPDVDFKEVKIIPDKSKYSVVKAEQWIVVSAGTTESIESIRGLVKIKGWQVVAVGDANTPSDWIIKGAIFLSLEDQAALGYRILAHLPFDDPRARKAVGYLFAIHHGAKKIYDADGISSVLDGSLQNVFDLELSGPGSRTEPLLQYLSTPNRTCVNPYIHFGQRSAWPRGLPLELVSQIEPDLSYGQVFSGKQFIQQGLANGLPDVDSVFYHTRKSSAERFDLRFDSLAPPVALPQGTMAPLNSANTLFHSSAFWALMLPLSVSPKASDVFRGYWAQRLLWEIGGYLVVYPPTIHRPDVGKEPPLFGDEKDLHKDVTRLIRFLLSWRSHKVSLFHKALHLSHSLAEEGFWTGLDVAYTVDWLQDLISVGYLQPRLFTLELDRVVSLSLHSHHQDFVPLRLPSMHLGVEEASSVSSEIGSLLKWRKFYGNIVLILQCSWPHTNHTALGWKMLYGRIFKSVVLISQYNNVDLRIEAADLMRPYKSIPNILERYSNAEGFLFMKDDVILNYWNLLEADKTKLWSLHKVNEAWKVVNNNENGTEWYHRTSLKNRIQTMLSSLPVHFRIAYGENIDNDHFVVCNSSVFYVPQRFGADFIDLAKAGVAAKLRQEVAIPLFFLAMDSVKNFDELAFSKVAYIAEDALNPSAVYSAEAHTVFPWNVESEADIVSVIKAMSAGDPLLLEVL